MNPEDIVITKLPDDFKMIRKFPSTSFLKKKRLMKTFLKQQEHYFLKIIFEHHRQLFDN